MPPRISTISPTGGERSNAAARRQSAAEPPSLARYEVRAVDRCIETQWLVAKPRTPHLHCAARAALQAQIPQCRGSRGTPLAFLWGMQRGYSLRKENTPFAWQQRKELHYSCSANGAATPIPPRMGRSKGIPSSEREYPFLGAKKEPSHRTTLIFCSISQCG